MREQWASAVGRYRVRFNETAETYFWSFCCRPVPCRATRGTRYEHQPSPLPLVSYLAKCSIILRARANTPPTNVRTMEKYCTLNLASRIHPASSPIAQLIPHRPAPLAEPFPMEPGTIHGVLTPGLCTVPAITILTNGCHRGERSTMFEMSPTVNWPVYEPHLDLHLPRIGNDPTCKAKLCFDATLRPSMFS